MQRWIDARKKFHLSHAHVQMARELGMNPRKLGSIDNHRQEPWKAPLPIFIEQLYQKRSAESAPIAFFPLRTDYRSLPPRKLKDVNGKEGWKQIMIARKRKTMVLCNACHDLLHAGKLSDRQKKF